MSSSARMMWTLSHATKQVGGTLHGTDARFSAVGTDSRTDCSGQLFIALRGEHFDAHAYVAQAREHGAVAAMVDHPLEIDLPQWIVDDTRLGLGQLAAAWRDRFAGRIVAITGSNGKTTVKEMVAAILSHSGSTLATKGNLNNDIGMPLTLLGARDEDYLVLEMGANHADEIGYMTDIARPDLALITNAGRAHLEGFGTLEGVARAKGEIARGLDSAGVLVVDGDSPFIALWRELAGTRRVLEFGLSDASEVSADPASARVAWDEDGFRTEFSARVAGRSMPLALRLTGQHNVRNALAAVAVATALGVEASAIRDGLASLHPVKGRLYPCPCAGLGVIDDTYNANPDSIAAAIEVLAGLSGQRWLVIGDLGELGADALALHHEIGERARSAGVERMATVGSSSAETSRAFGRGAAHFADQTALIAHLKSELGRDDRVLVKGSRLARMEHVVEALCAEVKP